MGSKYKEIRRLEASALRALCIRKDWYTRGDNDEYGHLLLDLAGNKPHLDTGGIIAIAEDIAAHSDLEEGCTIGDIAFEVARACYVTFEPVTGEERSGLSPPGADLPRSGRHGQGQRPAGYLKKKEGDAG